MEKVTLERWESRGGKYWAEFYMVAQVPPSYGYTSDNAGGNIGILTERAARETFRQKVESGYFLPDYAKTPMRLIYSKGFGK